VMRRGVEARGPVHRRSPAHAAPRRMVTPCRRLRRPTPGRAADCDHLRSRMRNSDSRRAALSIDDHDVGPWRAPDLCGRFAPPAPLPITTTSPSAGRARAPARRSSPSPRRSYLMGSATIRPAAPEDGIADGGPSGLAVVPGRLDQLVRAWWQPRADRQRLVAPARRGRRQSLRAGGRHRRPERERDARRREAARESQSTARCTEGLRPDTERSNLRLPATARAPAFPGRSQRAPRG
jgi:hypothetical protein